MRFGILGPLRAEQPDGSPIPPGGPRLRALLVMLLIDAGRPVGIERLIDGLYGEHPPTGAANALQSQVSRLRQSLPVEREPAGYRLAIDPSEVDAHRFTVHAAEGRRALTAGEPHRAAKILREATALWRGEALADVRDAPFAAAHADRLAELRLTATEDLFEAELGSELSGDAITELRALVAAHPLRERPWGLLMRALAAAGRSTEALSVYADARHTFAEELGADPSPELTEIHTALLRRTTRPRTPAPGGAAPPVTAPTGTAPTGCAPTGSASMGAASPGATPSGTAPTRTAPTGAASLGAAPSAGGSPLAGAAGGPLIAGSRGGPARRGVPVALTSFVGRDSDLSRVTKALTSARLVTLHGPGGAGKTRLATETAARHDGDCCFVELAAATGDDVPRAVLEALGLREAGLSDRTHAGAEAPAAIDRMVAALADRRMLLVLDNCEHVVEEAAALTGRLLAAAPGLRVLATSREPLGITGEALHPVGGLPVPPPAGVVPEVGVVPGVDDLMTYPAVRLFADRAADVSPGFAVTSENAASVGRICRMLDGQPLAVELAAARLHGLSVDEVAARLDDRFRLLSRGSRTAASRHRTLHAVVAWSWDLLAEPERVLARRFTIFAGGADLRAIEAVCGEAAGVSMGALAHSDAGWDKSEIVDILAGLVGKSLIERDGGRYRMLATIRAFCAERLTESGERPRMVAAHAAYFRDLAVTADPWLRTAGQLTWLDRLDADRDNLHAALRHGDVRTSLRLAAALSFYWWLRGLRAEATALSERLLQRAGAEPPPGMTEEYALCVLNAALGGTRPAEPWDSYLMSLEAPPTQPFLLYLSAMAVGPPESPPGDVVALNKHLRERLGGEPWCAALGAIGGGWMLLFAGAGPDAAESDFAVALAGFRAIGERWGAMLALSGIAELEIWRGNPAAAIEPIGEALRLATELGSTVDVADLLRGRGEGRLSAGDLGGAAEDFARSAELARDCGALELLAAARLGEGAIALRTGDLDEASRRCAAALAACPAGWFGADGTRMSIFVMLGRIAEARGSTAEAAEHYRSVLTVRGGLLGAQTTAEAIDRLAGLALTAGEPSRAAETLGTVVALQLRAGSAESELAARVAAGVVAELGEQGYAAALSRGESLFPEDALALLRS
ncbi:putative AfsR-family transcriptional regulator [Actinoplanes missouriensis 431]|uniref:Putative AfsR-family transcriptional regulator n=1 Tax=Actinoplanes missouriensis (strain ATCC 14538 / DSM 43046 / CBS 188.64 / JCM 3121 / NBRC 102363 / NCIMB 12654 / NRRL B-3342 / UNCC 431) TaxID=512565 RepID=I0HBZ7_ACTM4|nr:BTAD domain-containing putative transcriptional regulator [Actinoplanes missouriensis]BAL90534.1 putative AfsR-family transcriptional regulator [Actinoplanes missouriensis 431]